MATQNRLHTHHFLGQLGWTAAWLASLVPVVFTALMVIAALITVYGDFIRGAMCSIMLVLLNWFVHYQKTIATPVTLG